MKYRVSKSATRDLDDIFDYWAEVAGPEIANRIIERIAERFWLLAEYPEAGRVCHDFGLGVLCFPAGKYLIYYRKVRGGVWIAHIFDGRRNQKRAWKPGKSSR
jgi:toxin ParE1/3/4